MGAESLGVRGLCCLVTVGRRRIVIDPGIALGYTRYRLLPHPLQVGVGRVIRNHIVAALDTATDVVFSHYHGDHVPLAAANPYQLSVQDLPASFAGLRCWSKSAAGLSPHMAGRFTELQRLLDDDDGVRVAEGCSEGPLSFSRPVAHGASGSPHGTVMMTRIEDGAQVFVHASDIQLLDEHAVDQIIAWRPTVVLVSGPPLYLTCVDAAARDSAWVNAVRLVRNTFTVIIDHHLMRGVEGEVWLQELARVTGRRVFCAADFMGTPRRPLEAQRTQLYREMPVPEGWHRRYAAGQTTVRRYFAGLPVGAS